MLRPSPRYFAALEASKAHHGRSKTFSGRFLFRYFDELKKVVDEFECKTLLDYGCGKGKQWNEPTEEGWMLVDRLGVTPTLYDPAWPAYATEPTGKFDIVVCTQALGSIPVIDLKWAVDRIYGFATKAAFFGESLGPVKKVLHDHMKAEMPHEWTHDQWAAVLRRPGDVAGFLQTHNRVEQLSRFERL